jgi:hypothetical protein
MKMSLKKVSVAGALLAGVAGWSGAQATTLDVSAPLALTGTVAHNSVTYGRTSPAETLFTDTFTFTLASPTTWSTFSDFKVSSTSATGGLDLYSFTLSGPTGSSGNQVQTGITELWTLPTLSLGNGSYTITVTGKFHSRSSLTLDGNIVTAVPEPETYGMLLGGLGVLCLVARRKRNAGKKT